MLAPRERAQAEHGWRRRRTKADHAPSLQSEGRDSTPNAGRPPRFFYGKRLPLSRLLGVRPETSMFFEVLRPTYHTSEAFA